MADTTDFRQQEPYLSMSKEDIEINIAEIRDICAALAPFCTEDRVEAIRLRPDWVKRLVSIAETWAYVAEIMWEAEAGIKKAPKN